MKLKIIAFFLCISLLIPILQRQTYGENLTDTGNNSEKLSLDCTSALLMEAETGMILYENNADERLPPASVTKIMTLLLVMEAIDSGRLSLGDTVTASPHACSMGGTQIYLEAGEQMSVEDLLKSVIIASANDAAVALAEHIAGSEGAFVDMMNKRAKSLGMTGTNFENTNGLDDTAKEHVTTARDIAIMSRELIKHKKIIEYSSIWMDTVRDGSFGLTNTNRLIRFYKGATGLKTGSTAKAKFCISATAERDGMTLIAVIMASPTRDGRNAAAAALLDYGFANFSVYKDGGGRVDPIKVIGGERAECGAAYSGFSAVLSKGDTSKVEIRREFDEGISAPVLKGAKVGKVTYSIGGKVIGEVDIVAEESVERIGFFTLFRRLLARFSI